MLIGSSLGRVSRITSQSMYPQLNHWDRTLKPKQGNLSRASNRTGLVRTKSVTIVTDPASDLAICPEDWSLPVTIASPCTPYDQIRVISDPKVLTLVRPGHWSGPDTI